MTLSPNENEPAHRFNESSLNTQRSNVWHLARQSRRWSWWRRWVVGQTPVGVRSEVGNQIVDRTDNHIAFGLLWKARVVRAALKSIVNSRPHTAARCHTEIDTLWCAHTPWIKCSIPGSIQVTHRSLKLIAILLIPIVAVRKVIIGTSLVGCIQREWKIRRDIQPGLAAVLGGGCQRVFDNRIW